MAEDILLSISEASELLGVSVSTLRRWDESGRFAPQKTPGEHRRYSKTQIDLYLRDLVALAQDWALNGTELPSQFYCELSSVFQSRLQRMGTEMEVLPEMKDIFPLAVSVAGEIGSNSFDHNLGSWPDTPGIFFGYDVHKRVIVLADRGQGILTTLVRVRPNLASHGEALNVAFTEIVSGREPENRGNGLKYVRDVVTQNPMGLTFQTGNAELELEKDSSALNIHAARFEIRGCFAKISF